MVRFQVRMFQGFFDRDTRRRVKGKQLFKQIEGNRCGFGVQLLPRDFLGHRQRLDVQLGSFGANATKGGVVGCSEHLENLVQLVDIYCVYEPSVL